MKKKILEKMYISVDKMNKYIIAGDIENATRERVSQMQLRKMMEEQSEKFK